MGGWQETRLQYYGRKIGETTNGVYVGAKVRIQKNASWWNSEEVNKWWIGQTWYVHALDGNKATIGKEILGDYNAKKEISTNYLEVIPEGEDGK